MLLLQQSRVIRNPEWLLPPKLMGSWLAGCYRALLLAGWLAAVLCFRVPRAVLFLAFFSFVFFSLIVVVFSPVLLFFFSSVFVFVSNCLVLWLPFFLFTRAFIAVGIAWPKSPCCVCHNVRL